jgi:hypothetical protein
MRLFGKWQQNAFQVILVLNLKHEIPAFAEAASRRQAKFETISNDQILNVRNKKSL